MRGVYAVGRPEVGRRGMWMSAVLAGGPRALLSHHSAAALWKIRRWDERPVEIVVPPSHSRRRRGIRIYGRREHETPGRREVDGIPVVHPVAALVDLATCVPTGQLEAAINEADHRSLVDPERLAEAIDSIPGDRESAACASSSPRRRPRSPPPGWSSSFLPLAFDVGLPAPQTQVWLDGHRVDFFWPDLGLVVEADSLRYHRTAFKQGRDKRRDNAHASSGLTTLRFTRGQIRHEPDYVRKTLATTAQFLAGE